MRIIDIALKDLSQVVRDRKMLLFLVLMPLVFTLFMGFAFRGALDGGEESDPRLPVGFVNDDPQGALGPALHRLLEPSDAVRLEDLPSGAAEEAVVQVRKGDLAAALVIPAGFSEEILLGEGVPLSDLEQSTFSRQPVLIADEANAGGQAARQAVQTAFMRLMSAVEIAQISIQEAGTIQPYPSEAERQAALQEAFAQAAQAWAEPALAIEVQKAVGQPQPTGPIGDNPYNQSSPGMIVQFAIFGLISTSSLLVLERKGRTLQRMLTTSTRRGEIIAGHLLAMFAAVFLQQVILVLFGQLVLGVDYLRAPLATLLVVVALSLWIAGLGMFIGTFAKSDEQALLFSLIAMFVFTALGGAWFPLEGTGPAFSLVGRLTPGAHAMDGFQNLIVRGLGLSSVLLPTGVLLAYSLLFFGLALWKFRTE
jgi:ABC-2 type transport system permease protein